MEKDSQWRLDAIPPKEDEVMKGTGLHALI
jgi:hypothetical protein